MVKFWTAIEMVHADGRTEKFPLPTGSKHPFNYINSANFAFEVDFHIFTQFRTYVHDNNPCLGGARETVFGVWCKRE